MKGVSGGTATVAEVNNQEDGKLDLEEGARRAGVIPEENKGQAKPQQAAKKKNELP